MDDGMLNSSFTGSASPSTSSAASPVTWHVAFWVLLSLAVNSMAQPSGMICSVPRRYRIYLSSSPLICLADALCMALQLVTTALFLRVSPPKASMLVLLRRVEKSHSGHGTTTKVEHGAEGRTWPRWVLFVMGTLPAAIKVTSFQGTPWTKVWALMFVVSFVIIEFITVLARVGGPEHESVPAVLDLSEIEWQAPQHQTLRSKVALLKKWIDFLDVSIFVLVLLTHLGIGIWAIERLWLLALPVLRSSNTARDIRRGVQLVNSTLFILLGATDVVLWWVGYAGYKFKPIVLVWFYVIVMMSLHDRKSEEQGFFRRLGDFNETMGIWGWLLGLVFICQRTMTWICKRWPGLAKALLIEPNLHEGLQDPGRAANTTVEGEPEPMDEGGWVSLWFFLSNLLVCLLWYAFLYDQTGTLNPSWTDVFG